MADEIDGGDFDRRLDIADGPTEVVTLAASFDAMQDRLHRAAAAQRQFIEDTSHELRTPLAVLDTNADVTLAAPEPTLESYAKALRRSKDTARRLSALVDELLVDARGKSRTIDRRPADLVELAKEAIDAVAPFAIERRVVLHLEAPRPVPCAVDRVSIVRALRNLVDNAIRYGDTDATVEVNVSADRGDGVVSVSDNGPGIPTDEQEAIFQRFWRTRSDQAGSGLGLPIVYQIAEAHGGSVTVRSPGTRGDGSSFELRVPMRSP